MLSLPNKDMADSVIYERGCALILRLKFKSSKESVTSRWSGRAMAVRWEMVYWTRSPVFFSWSFTGLTESWSRGALCSALIGQSMPCAFKAVCKAKYHIPGWDVSIHLYRFTRESDLNFAAASYRNGAIICQPWGLRRYHCRDIRDELGDMNIQN